METRLAMQLTSWPAIITFITLSLIKFLECIIGGTECRSYKQYLAVSKGLG